MRIVIVPGIDDSPRDHWQSRWQEAFGSAAVRIAPVSFEDPDAGDWLEAIERATTSDDVLVTHSLGCLAAASWVTHGGRAAGAFLVAPPDETGPNFPAAAAGFTAPRSPLGIPSVIVASEDDPYSTLEHLAELSAWWESPVIRIGAHGHLNRASRLGEWDEGRRLLTAFVAGLGHRLPAS
jgi:predicted alpha/beta hydrolase family esterase